MKLILASSSPQRRRLLEQAGYELCVVPPSVTAECGLCSQETPPEYAARMAYQKAADVAKRVDGGTLVVGDTVIACDTIVACDTVVECAGQILGKPADRQHARQMLELLSGRVHHVYSGLCLWPVGTGQPHVAVDVTRLEMDTLGGDQLDEYLASGQWDGKAGAFGYQDRVGWLHIAEGSESNVIGLPLELLAKMLGELKLQ